MILHFFFQIVNLIYTNYKEVMSKSLNIVFICKMSSFVMNVIGVDTR